MLANLALATLLIPTTVLIHTFELMLLSRAMRLIIRRPQLHRHGFVKTAAMVTPVLGLFAVHTVEIWLWAGAYLAIGAVRDLEHALYRHPSRRWATATSRSAPSGGCSPLWKASTASS